VSGRGLRVLVSGLPLPLQLIKRLLNSRRGHSVAHQSGLTPSAQQGAGQTDGRTDMCLSVCLAVATYTQ